MEMLSQASMDIEANLQVSSAAEDAGLRAFKEDMKILLNGALGYPGGRMGHMIKYDYSSVTAPGSRDSSAELWTRVTLLGAQSQYFIPQAEGRMVDQSEEYLRGLFTEAPTMIDLGPGGPHAVDLKSAPTARYVGAKRYIPFDINQDFAEHASLAVKRRAPGIETSEIVGDFTKPTVITVDNAPLFMTMYGCTLSQYPMAGQGPKTEKTLEEVLSNLSEMTGHRATFLATIDTTQHGPTARDCYVGQHFSQFKRQFWTTAKTLIESSPLTGVPGGDPDNFVRIEGDNRANPSDAVVYDPRFENSGIVHSFYIRKQMLIRIDGQTFDIPRGLQIDTGFSQKWDLADVTRAIKRTGWGLPNVLIDSQSPIRGLIMTGRNVDPVQVGRAAGRRLQSSGNGSRQSAPRRQEKQRVAAGGGLNPFARVAYG